MKKIIFLLFSISLLLSCSSDSIYNNPNLPNYSFSISIDTNLPLYSGLKQPIYPIYIAQNNVGINGIIVMKVSDSDYRAWEANCPNHPPSNCARMSPSGVLAKCNCDSEQFSLLTGVGKGQYTMKPYKVEVLSGNVIRVYN